MTAPPYEWPTRMPGLLTRPSVRFTAATSPASVSRPYWAAITSCPSARSVGITLLKDEPSAQTRGRTRCSAWFAWTYSCSLRDSPVLKVLLGLVGPGIANRAPDGKSSMTAVYLADRAPNLRHSPKLRRRARDPSGWLKRCGAGLAPTRAVATRHAMRS